MKTTGTTTTSMRIRTTMTTMMITTMTTMSTMMKRMTRATMRRGEPSSPAALAMLPWPMPPRNRLLQLSLQSPQMEEAAAPWQAKPRHQVTQPLPQPRPSRRIRLWRKRHQLQSRQRQLLPQTRLRWLLTLLHQLRQSLRQWLRQWLLQCQWRLPQQEVKPQALLPRTHLLPKEATKHQAIRKMVVRMATGRSETEKKMVTDGADLAAAGVAAAAALPAGESASKQRRWRFAPRRRLRSLTQMTT
mmetsp:Transcript_4660/g.10215  ORF Transcript_4660/g.10215 Transcript_4660/m.10215 type:complete len:245 (+) Transcript_4660:904-1638(+)